MKLALDGPADRLVTAGTISMSNTTLAGFDLGRKMAVIETMAGIQGGPNTQIQTISGNIRVAPDRKEAYTVITNGVGGNKRCEFWVIDVGTSALARTSEVPCRSRFSFGLSSNGKKLYLYGAGFEIEVYDAVTLKREAVWDLGHDMTGSLVAIP